MRFPPWCETEKPPDGADALVTLPNETWWASSVGDAFKRALDAHAELGHRKLSGFLHPEYKVPCRVQVLWWNESSDSHMPGRHQYLENLRLAVAVRENANDQGSQEQAPDSHITFNVETVSYWNMNHFLNCSKTCWPRAQILPRDSHFHWRRWWVNQLCPLHLWKLPVSFVATALGGSCVYFPHGISVSGHIRNLLHDPLLPDLDFFYWFQNNSSVFWQSFAF